MLRAIRDAATSVVALALFFFVFLTGEFCFDTVMGGLVGSESVVLAQGLVLGASVVGFVAYAPLERVLLERRSLSLAVGATTLAVSFVALFLLADVSAVQVVGCVAFVILGIAGGAAHRVASVSFAGPYLSRLVAASYAAGLLLQFLVNNLLGSMPVELCLLAVAGAGLIVCLGRASGEVLIPAADDVEVKAASGLDGNAARGLHRELVGMVVAIVLMTCLFGTLDNIVTMANARGDVQLASWPRLLLAASALLAGWTFDLKDRRPMPIVMFCMAMLSTIAVLVLEEGGSAWLCAVIFFLSSGFYAVYLTSSFLILAPLTKGPSLWAGMGRALNNAVALVIAIPSLALVQSGDIILIFIVDLVLFVGIALSLFLVMSEASTWLTPASVKSTPTPALSLDERMGLFQETYHLTPREREVLEPVVTTEAPLKQVAIDLGISLRMVQRHLSSVYEKTGTQTRAGLSKRFWED